MVWFGFDVTHSWMVGTERVLVALAEDPEWIVDMWRTELDTELALLDMVWDAGYTFDSIMWYDDMGYKQNQFFSLQACTATCSSPSTRRPSTGRTPKASRPTCIRAATCVPSCPSWWRWAWTRSTRWRSRRAWTRARSSASTATGWSSTAGINAVLWDQPEAIQAEMERVVPVMKENGGYIFSSDHSVPSSVSLEDFRRIVALAKKLGSYA